MNQSYLDKYPEISIYNNTVTFYSKKRRLWSFYLMDINIINVINKLKEKCSVIDFNNHNMYILVHGDTLLFSRSHSKNILFKTNKRILFIDVLEKYLIDKQKNKIKYDKYYILIFILSGWILSLLLFI